MSSARPPAAQGIFITLFTLTVLALLFAIFGDGKDYLIANGQLTDAELIEHRGQVPSNQVAILRVSDPNQQILCSIWRDSFGDDWPPVGTILPVEWDGNYCYLPTLHVGVPRVELGIGGSIGLAILIGWGWTKWRGRQRRQRADKAGRRERGFAHAARVRAEARTRTP